MKNKSFPTLDKVIELTSKGLDREVNDIALFEFICTVLGKFEGKQVSARFITALKDRFGADTYCVMQHQNIGIPSVHLYGPTVPGHHTYETRFHFFLPCHGKSGQPFSVEAMRQDNQCFGPAAQKRAEARNATLIDESPLRRAAIAIDNYIAAKAELTEALAGIEDRYAIEAAFKLRD